ncbi:MAG: phospholipase D-like domain-containing protein [Chlamydiota bacterium]
MLKFLKSPSVKRGITLSSLLIIIAAAIFISQPRLPKPEEPPRFYATQNRDDLRILFKTALSQAANTINLQSYSLSDPKIMHRLNQKSEEDCQIKVSIDKKQAAHLYKALNKKIKIYAPRTKGLMHRKIAIIDDMQVWIGSANLTTESLRIHDNLVMGMVSPQLAEVIAADTPGKHSITVGGQQLEYWSLPDDGQALSRVLQLINNAKKSVKIAMFTWTSQPITQAIIDAHHRGVRIHALIDNNSSKGASKKTVTLLKENGIPIYRSQGLGLLHHKFAYIDDKTLVNGSANWTKAAFEKNRECFLVIDQLTPKQKKFMDKLWKNASLEAQTHD